MAISMVCASLGSRPLDSKWMKGQLGETMSIKLNKPVSRETTAKVFERSVRRPVVVTLSPPCQVVLHLKGSRQKVSFDVDALWFLGVRQNVK